MHQGTLLRPGSPVRDVPFGAEKMQKKNLTAAGHKNASAGGKKLAQVKLLCYKLGS